VVGSRAAAAQRPSVGRHDDDPRKEPS
jgi:hypothetical protein